MRAPAAVVLILLAGILPTGCMRPQPAEAPPALALPAAMPGVGAVGLAVTPDDPWPRWWDAFDDPALAALVGEARRRSPDMRVAYARVRAARAGARAEGAARSAQVEGSGAYSRERRGQGSSRIGSSTANDPFDLWSLGVDASYELDLFGRLRSAEQAALADAYAIDEDRRAMEVTLIADVARAYFDVQAARATGTIARDTVRLLHETYELVNARVLSGVGSELELERVRGEEAVARAAIPEARRRAALAANRLSFLLGDPPGRSFDVAEAGFFQGPPEVPVGLPAALVRRRPDLRAAERRTCAAHARLRQAVAEFYPSVSLVARGGLTSIDLGSLISADAGYFGLGPQVSIPIFQGGRLVATRLMRLAEQDEAAATYAVALLRALAEVADAVAGWESRLETRARLVEAVESQRRAVALANAQYEAQLVSYLPVLDSQSALARARRDLVEAERQLREEVIRLGKALGGGWEPPAGPFPPAPPPPPP